LCKQALEYVFCDLYIVFHPYYCQTNRIMSGDPFIVDAIFSLCSTYCHVSFGIPHCSAIIPHVCDIVTIGIESSIIYFIHNMYFVYYD